MKYFIISKFLKHLNRICKYWYTLCCGQQAETHINQPTENPYKSRNTSTWAFLQKPFWTKNQKKLETQKNLPSFVSENGFFSNPELNPPPIGWNQKMHKHNHGWPPVILSISHWTKNALAAAKMHLQLEFSPKSKSDNWFSSYSRKR